MGSWGVKSYENDDAGDALDAAFDRVHGDRYGELMDDSNSMTFDQVQETLADPKTLAASVNWLIEQSGPISDDWDEDQRLALVGVIVRHAEYGIPVPSEWKERAISWLENDSIEWEEETLRNLRRRKEIAMLRGAS